VLRAKLPKYSPDGRRIVFVVQQQNNSQDVWMMNADGSNAAPMVSEPG
jgi:Tol biopolymer transport system component